jgi:hypothetical protein
MICDEGKAEEEA